LRCIAIAANRTYDGTLKCIAIATNSTCTSSTMVGGRYV